MPNNDGHHENELWREKAKAGMLKYQNYVKELAKHLPSSYTRLQTFLERGNCKCHLTKSLQQSPCNSADTEGHCACSDPESRTCCHPNGNRCRAGQVEDTVRVYDIYPSEEEDWKNFLVSNSYRAGNPTEFEQLQEKIYLNSTAEVQPNDRITDPFEHKLPCRIITVSHLSPNVAKLLGAQYDISADFFNRHLPGTEALSGRLISRLPSCLQIDLDELYESNMEFGELWPDCKPDEDGHHFISDAIRRSFLFRVGWDYFPVSKKNWDSSLENIPLSSGYEVLLQDDAPKNVFQFNLAHRISVYSRPPKHPRTVIIIFYPTLPIHSANDAYSTKLSVPNGIHAAHIPPRPKGGEPFSGSMEGENDSGRKATLDKMKSMADSGSPSTLELVGFRAIPNLVPTPAEMEELHNDPDIKDWESVEAKKQGYAVAFDRNFRIHAKNHFKQHSKDPREPWTKEMTSTGKGARAMFIHLFGAPLFKMVAANWARLIVRRSFDLDLLEWRGKQHMSSSTIEEIKSRRIAIGRHQRDIAASLEVLRGLMLEEQGETSETHPEFNKGRSNGFVMEAADEDSWSRIYFDFFELSASMDALESRANKIQDGMVGLISVFNSEETAQSNMNASILNKMAFVFSVILLPFSIVGPIFGAELILGDLTSKRSKFLIAMFAAFAAVLGSFLFFLFVQLYSEPDHIRPKWVSKVRVRVEASTKAMRKTMGFEAGDDDGHDKNSQERHKGLAILKSLIRNTEHRQRASVV